MMGDGSARFAAAVGQQVPERERTKSCDEGEAQHEARGFAHCRARGSNQFKDGNKQEQADRKVPHERMKAANELLPVRVRFAVELYEPRQKKKCSAKQERKDPLSSCQLALRGQP